MSERTVRELVERMKTDAAFRDQVLQAGDAAARVDFVTSQGYAVTADELSRYAGRLDDAQLEAAVGGTTGVTGSPLLDGPTHVVVCSPGA